MSEALAAGPTPSQGGGMARVEPKVGRDGIGLGIGLCFFYFLFFSISFLFQIGMFKSIFKSLF
jgi:hypothetical protein